MKLENQVCSLTLAQRLKELGVKQESLFYWAKWESKPTSKKWGVVSKLRHSYDGREPEHYVSAFTVAELGEMLLNHRNIRHRFVNAGEGKRWVTSNDERNYFADTEADARARMLIYLLENNLITPTLCQEK